MVQGLQTEQALPYIIGQLEEVEKTNIFLRMLVCVMMDQLIHFITDSEFQKHNCYNLVNCTLHPIGS